jgi:ABC-type glutathione transport system ATPase component
MSPNRRQHRDGKYRDGRYSDAAPRRARPSEEGLPLIKVVGQSGSGKSTLVQFLRQMGYNARPVSQEHSHIPNLWQQFDRPLFLIYLSVNEAAARARRPNSDINPVAMNEELARLSHAREHADLRVDTSDLSAADVAKLALTFLQRHNVRHADGPLPPISPTGAPRRSA